MGATILIWESLIDLLWSAYALASRFDVFFRLVLTGANVAVAEVRGLRGLDVLVLERREAVLGKGRHSGVIGGPHFDLVEPGRVAREDQLLDGAVGVAERREAVFLLHVLRDFEPAHRLDLPLR